MLMWRSIGEYIGRENSTVESLAIDIAGLLFEVRMRNVEARLMILAIVIVRRKIEPGGLM